MPALLGVLMLTGCGERDDSGLVAVTAVQRATLLAGTTTGPGALLLTVPAPQAVDLGGAIALTGGTQIVLVDPQALPPATVPVLDFGRWQAHKRDEQRLDAALATLIQRSDALLQALPVVAPACPPAAHARARPAPPPMPPPPAAPPAPTAAAPSTAPRSDLVRVRQALALAEDMAARAQSLDRIQDRTIAGLLTTQAMSRAAASAQPSDYQEALAAGQSRHLEALRLAHQAELTALRAQLIAALTALAALPPAPAVAAARVRAQRSGHGDGAGAGAGDDAGTGAGAGAGSEVAHAGP